MEKTYKVTQPKLRAEPHPATGAWLSVVRAYNTCSKSIANQIADSGLNLLQHEILLNLLVKPGISQQQLAMRCFSAKSGVSAIVSDFEKDGIIVRRQDEEDSRKKILFLSEKGFEMAQVNLKLQNEIVETMASVYTSNGLKDLEDGMNSASALLKDKFL